MAGGGVKGYTVKTTFASPVPVWTRQLFPKWRRPQLALTPAAPERSGS